VVWFGFEVKSHMNGKIKNIWFGLVPLTFKIKFEPNQCGLGWIDLCGFYRDNTIFRFQH